MNIAQYPKRAVASRPTCVLLGMEGSKKDTQRQKKPGADPTVRQTATFFVAFVWVSLAGVLASSARLRFAR